MVLDSYRQYGRNSFNRCNQTMNCVPSNIQKNQCIPSENNIETPKKQKMLAYGYFKVQTFDELYCPSVALKEGTAFPCLNLIFCGSRGRM